MFNLDQSIKEWRRQMAVSGVKTPAVLDELEAHLREDVERQMQTGMSETAAFESAAQRIGRSDLLKAEFAKIEGQKQVRMGKIIGTGCCVFAGLYSLTLIPALFTISELSPLQRTLGLSAVALTFLSVVTLRFNYKFLPAIRNRRARTALIAGCSLAGVAWLLISANLLPNVIVPHFMENSASAESLRGSVLIGLRQAAPDALSAVFAVGLSLLWAMTLAAILGGIAYGLEEAARRTQNDNAYV